MTQRLDEPGASYYTRAIKPYRERHARKGLCRWCSKPVALKKNGQRAKLCTVHLEYERRRIAERKLWSAPSTWDLLVRAWDRLGFVIASELCADELRRGRNW